MERLIKEKLSIIVPVYNAERWIGRCLDSLINQTFRNLEIVIINDGSADNSGSIIKQYCKKDERIKCITTKNQGSAEAKNTGLRYISGELVTFVDADDYIEDKMYETMVSVLNQRDADIVECGCRKINTVGRTLYKFKLEDEEIIGNEACARHFMRQRNTRNYMCNKVYRSKLFEKVRFPSLRFSEDYYMNAVLHSKIEKKIIISPIYYNYMIYSEQCTNNHRIEEARFDGIKAGRMAAEYFSYAPSLRDYAVLYACDYALFVSEILYKNDAGLVKNFRRVINRELLSVFPYISLQLLKNREQKKVIFKALLLFIFNYHFFTFQWLLEV